MNGACQQKNPAGDGRPRGMQDPASRLAPLLPSPSPPGYIRAVSEELEILYHDGHYVAVHKPCGLFVHPSALEARAANCLDLLRDRLTEPPYTVHRLDRATSGVLLFALGPEAAHRIGRLFADREVEKRYLAVVRGHPPLQGRVERALRERDTGAVREAVTEFRRLRTAVLEAQVGPYPQAWYALVEAAPLTGRRHQIRRHLAHISHPIVGDTSYGDNAHNVYFREAFGMRRLLLLASELSFTHPFTGAPVTIRAPLPADVRRLFDRLGWADTPGLEVRHPPQ